MSLRSPAAAQPLCRVPDTWEGGTAGSVPTVVASARLGQPAAADLSVAPVAADVWLLQAEAPGEITLLLTSDATEHFAGGGEQFVRLDLAGRQIDGWCADGASELSYFQAPIIHCSAGWTLIVDTTARYQLDLGAGDPEVVSVTLPDGRLRAFLSAGPPRRGVEVLLELTGRAPLPPPWALGVWHNVRSGSDEVLRQALRLQAERIPASALWIDDHYDADTNDGDGWPGNYPLGTYPDTASMVDAIHALGMRALTYVNPMLYRDTPACVEAIEHGLVVTREDGSPWFQHFFHPWSGERGMVSFADDTAVPLDFTNPAAVEWWQEKVRRLLLERGWDGWMEDFGEQLPAAAVLHDGSTGAETHNRYPLLYHEATATVREAVKPDSVVFARSGWLGAQRHASLYWGGDQLCSWDESFGMPSAIAGGLSAALSGVAVWGLDITGIVSPEGTPLAEAAGDRELWLRWCQLGALTPVMRTHLGFKPEPTPPLDLWHDAEMTDAFRRDATFHLRLFPYLYSLATGAADGGMPVMRPLLLEFPDDEQCWTVHHQFLLGDALLVAPVLERGARSRLVYLPAGRWYEFGSTVAHQGPVWLTVDAPLERIPLFQREGTVIPLLADTAPVSLCDERYATGDYDLELAVTPDGESARTLHDGTKVTLSGGELRVVGRGRTVLVRCGGIPAGLADGSDLDFDLRPMQRIMRMRRDDSKAAGPDHTAIYAARDAERHHGLHHEEMIDVEPVRPGEPVTLTVRESADVGLDRLAVHWRPDGGDPLEGEAATVEMTVVVEATPDAESAEDVAAAAPAMSGDSVLTATARVSDAGQRLWRAMLPAQGDGAVVRYAFSGARGDHRVWVEDAGPPLEGPDLDVAFIRPAERRFSYAVTSRTVPTWLREAVVYHVVLDRFHPGGEGRLPHDSAVRFLQHAGGTLRGLIEHLDHVSELGADCILLSPITRGVMHVPYDVTDLRDVDPHLGTLADARELCREAHSRGIRVVLDTEMSMLGYRHPYFTDARRNPASEYRDWFRWHEWPHRPYAWFGGRMLVTLDHGNPAVRRELLDATRFWLDVGFDGFRLDSAAMAPFDFWTEFGAAVREANPDAVTLGEVFGSPEYLGHYRGRLDGVLDYTIAHRLRACFGTREMTPQDVAGAVATMSQLAPDELVSPIFLENHDVARFSHIAAGSPERLRQALVVLLTLGPTPILYYGTEVGRSQGPHPDIDPDARLPMLWGDDQDRELLGFVRKLVRTRLASRALRRGRHMPLHANGDVYAFARVDDDSRDACAVVVNRGESPATVNLSIDTSAARPLLAASTAVTGSGRLRATVAAHTAEIFDLSPADR